MATTKQIIANRCNSLKSTGPNSPDGKDIISRNAVTHGLSAQKHLLSKLDDPDEFQQFRDRLWQDLNPVGQIEIMLAERILAAAWRLRRILRIETEFLEADFDKKQSRDPLNQRYDPHAQPTSLGSAVAQNLNSVNTYGKLIRHEIALERSLHRNLQQLQQLQSQRLNFSANVPPFLLFHLAQDQLPS